MSEELDSLELLNLVGKQVNFTLLDKSAVSGRVYTVDPETHNFVLMDQTTTTLLPFSNIAHLALLSSEEPRDVNLPDLPTIDFEHFPHTLQQFRETDCESLKETLLAHLERLRVPVVVGEKEILIAGVVVCRPPYNRDSCSSTNDIVLGRIQGILKTLHPL